MTLKMSNSHQWRKQKFVNFRESLRKKNLWSLIHLFNLRQCCPGSQSPIIKNYGYLKKGFEKRLLRLASLKWTYSYMSPVLPSGFQNFLTGSHSNKSSLSGNAFSTFVSTLSLASSATSSHASNWTIASASVLSIFKMRPIVFLPMATQSPTAFKWEFHSLTIKNCLGNLKFLYIFSVYFCCQFIMS